MQEYLCIGKITKPQGVRGEVKILPLTDDLARFQGITNIFVKGNAGYVLRRVTSSRIDSSFAYLTLDGVADMTAAERLRGLDIYVDRENAVPLPEGRWFIADLIGCHVFADGEEIGAVEDVLQAGGNDVYMLRAENGGTVMFPAIRELLRSVDVENARIEVDKQRLSQVAVYDN